jgi:hypothetical protein
MNKQEQIDALRFRIERIEQHFAEQHIPNNFGKCSEKPNGCEQYEQPDFIPDWNAAPEYARWVAMEKSGCWYWWTKMPSAYKNNPFGEGWWVSGAREQLAFSAGETTNADRLHPDYWKNSLQERPTKTEPDYTHLLPEGYEFCTEQDAEKWVKVEIIPYSTNQSELGYLAYDKSPISDNLKTYYRPIRPIQYHVAVHESVTTESDPYQVDWSNAPEWADVHSFDCNRIGYWYGVESDSSVWGAEFANSNLTLPSGLDWKQSKRRRIN